MKYRIGLDIGIASVGWCATETDENGEPTRIINLGSRIFDAAEHPKTGESLAAPRRAARSLRRVIRRREHRIERTKTLIAAEFGEETVRKVEKNEITDVVSLRVRGLDEPLNPVEIAKICLYFVKHRGFKSNRLSDGKNGKGDEGKLKTATDENRKKLAESGTRTWGEYLSQNAVCKTANGVIYLTRNKAGEYRHTPLRDMVSAEIDEIMSRQIVFGAISAGFATKYKNIFEGQRSFDEGPGKGSKYSGSLEKMIGKCTFEPDEYRGAKAAYTVEFTSVLEKLNNLRIIRDGDYRELTPEQREIVIRDVKDRWEVKLSRVRKLLRLDDNERFNISYAVSKTQKKDNVESDKRDVAELKAENAKYFKMTNSRHIADCLDVARVANVDLLDGIADILTRFKSEEKRRGKLEAMGLSAEEIEKLLGINVSGFSNLSIKARKKLLPYLLDGFKYTEACEKAGYGKIDESNQRLRLLKGDKIKAIIDDVGSPVVRRAVSQTIKVVNALVCAYGSPIGVNIEVARELSKTYEERKKIERGNKDRESDNAKLIERLKEYGRLSPNGLDIIKLRLYDEQNGKCAYSGNTIDIKRLFPDSDYAQVDHILPFSRSLDDGFANKTLVLTDENQNKGGRTPYEYFGDDEERWNEFETRIRSFNTISPKKRENYFKKNFDAGVAREWRERNLNDTKYVTSLALNIIKDYLQFEYLPNEKPNAKKVIALSGFITSYLRKFWGLNKVRSDGDKHHALDAAVISVTTDKLVAGITRYNKIKECFLRRPDGKAILIDGMESVFARDEFGRITDGDGLILDSDGYDEIVGRDKFPKPYEGFREELLIRLENGEESDDEPLPHFSERQRTRLSALGYSEDEIEASHPIFVSRVSRRKVTGAIHEATVWSAKRAESEGVIVKKTPLSSLKLDKDGEIDGYSHPETDRLLYNALKEQLARYDGDGKKAFAEPFYKPKSDGTKGAIVRSVKIEEDVKRGVFLDKKQGYAKNDSMVRVDVFTKGGKYFCVPVYVADVAKGVLPNKAIRANSDEWDEMDETYEFLFTVYPNDLVYVESRKPFNLTSPNKEIKETLQKTVTFMYYTGIDSATGNGSFKLHDNSFSTRLGLKTLKNFKKYVVDVLGNVTEVKKETRQPLKKRNNKFAEKVVNLK